MSTYRRLLVKSIMVLVFIFATATFLCIAPPQALGDAASTITAGSLTLSFPTLGTCSVTGNTIFTCTYNSVGYYTVEWTSPASDSPICTVSIWNSLNNFNGVNGNPVCAIGPSSQSLSTGPTCTPIDKKTSSCTLELLCTGEQAFTNSTSFPITIGIIPVPIDTQLSFICVQ